MSVAPNPTLTTAVIHLHPFGGATRQLPAVSYAARPRRVYEQGNVEALVTIIEGLLDRLLDERNEVERLSAALEAARGQLLHFQVRAVDFIVNWSDAT